MDKTESLTTDQSLENYPAVKNYLDGIPKDIHHLFVGESEQDLIELSSAIKRQRRDQQEREYVIEIQRRYRLPLRPNASVKATMIQARLRLRRLLSSTSNGKHYRGIVGELPVDPFE